MYMHITFQVNVRRPLPLFTIKNEKFIEIPDRILYTLTMPYERDERVISLKLYGCLASSNLYATFEMVTRKFVTVH